MSILTKLQDLRTEEENHTLTIDIAFADINAMMERVRALMAIQAKHEFEWLNSLSDSVYHAPCIPTTMKSQVLFPSTISAARNVVIYDYI